MCGGRRLVGEDIRNRAVYQLPCLCHAQEFVLPFEDSREVLKILKQGINMINVIYRSRS